MLWCHYCLYFHWSSVSFAEGDRKESTEVPVLGIWRFRAAQAASLTQSAWNQLFCSHLICMSVCFPHRTYFKWSACYNHIIRSEEYYAEALSVVFLHYLTWNIGCFSAIDSEQAADLMCCKWSYNSSKAPSLVQQHTGKKTYTRSCLPTCEDGSDIHRRVTLNRFIHKNTITFAVCWCQKCSLPSQWHL